MRAFAVLLFLSLVSQAHSAYYCVAIDSEFRHLWHPQEFDIRGCWTADSKAYCERWRRHDLTPPDNYHIRTVVVCTMPTTPGHIVMSHFSIRHINSIAPGTQPIVWPLPEFEYWPGSSAPEAWQLSRGRFHFEKDYGTILRIIRGKHPNNPR